MLSMDFNSKSINLLSSAQNDGCQSEAPSNEISEETKAVMAMKEKLPNYVIDSFIAAGFDTLEVISERTSSTLCENVGNKYNNTISYNEVSTAS